MPARAPTAYSYLAKPKRDIATQALVELTFRVDCLYATVGTPGTQALLRAVSGKPSHDFSAIIAHLLELCSDNFERVNNRGWVPPAARGWRRAPPNDNWNSPPLHLQHA